MIKRVGTVHGMAHCETCGELNGHYRNMQALAAKHAKHYGHIVHGETGIVYMYDGSCDKPKNKSPLKGVRQLGEE